MPFASADAECYDYAFATLLAAAAICHAADASQLSLPPLFRCH